MEIDSCKIINGKACAADLLENVKSNLSSFTAETGKNVGLAVILVGDDPASTIYVNNKAKRAKELGITSIIYKYDTTITTDALIDCINNLNTDPKINGILIQLPLPKHINTQRVIDTVNYEKDVDGFSSYNVGLLNSWQESLEPCTPQGVLILLKKYVEHDLTGKKVVVLGRSRIVGRPMVSMLIREGCSVISLNSYSKNTEEMCCDADIIISAVGSPTMIKKHWVAPGACVIDVGIVRVDGKLFGDVDFHTVKETAGFITPVPGGVGPMTVACLMQNTVKAAYIQHGVQWPKSY